MNQAELYARTNSNQYRDAQEIIQEYKDVIKWGEKDNILDIGCGPGNTTANLIFPIIPKSAKLLGTDISEDMIKFARKTFENNRLRFKTLDISADNVTDQLGTETFDKVFSFYCLHWISDQRKAAENVWKLMKPNGVALLVLVSNSPLFDLYKSLSKQSKWKKYMMDVDNYITPYQGESNPSKKYRNLLETVGFEVKKCYNKVAPVKVPNLQTLRKSLEAVNPFICRMTADLQNEYMDCIMRAIEDENFVIRQNRNGTEDELKYIKPNKLIIAYCRKINKST